MSEKGAVVIPVLLIVVIVLAFTVTHYLVKPETVDWFSQLPSITTPQPLPYSSTDKQIMQDTSTWKVYSDEVLQVELKYPSQWQVRQRCQGGALSDKYVCILSPDFDEADTVLAIGGGLVSGGMIIIDNSSGLAGHDHASDEICRTNPLETVLECHKVVIDGKPAWRRKLPHYTQVGIISEDRFIMSVQAIYTDDSEQEVLAVFDKVLSTLRLSP